MTVLEHLFGLTDAWSVGFRAHRSRATTIILCVPQIVLIIGQVDTLYTIAGRLLHEYFDPTS
jgi:hypothetical protein